MRYIIHGVGAIGGTLASLLALSGREVVGIARGAQLEAIRERGLTLRTPAGTRTARIDCVEDPAEIDLRPDDAIVLTVKTQHSATALDQLAAAGVADQPIFCAQNGVENERMALRYFDNVHGVLVMCPADFVTPGEVVAFGAPRSGIFDIGRFPHGSDADDAALAEALDASDAAGFVTDEVMDGKYGKLLMNLGNIVEAALGTEDELAPLKSLLREEAQRVLEAAGLSWRNVGLDDPRRKELMQMAPVEGVSRAGNSSTQSLVRGAGSLETAYLNGEIARLARQHGVAAPANAWFTRLGARLQRTGAAPGAVTLAEVETALGL